MKKIRITQTKKITDLGQISDIGNRIKYLINKPNNEITSDEYKEMKIYSIYTLAFLLLIFYGLFSLIKNILSLIF